MDGSGGKTMSVVRQTRAVARTVAVAAVAIAMWAPPALEAQRDRGLNQPGAAGNRGTVGVDPGVNQPGAAGNVGRDPGLNQPGAAGNVGYGGSARQVRAVSDPGLNQPGAAGNLSRDPGLNQPGAAGNRRR
jgi:hypothetical protein